MQKFIVILSCFVLCIASTAQDISKKYEKKIEKSIKFYEEEDYEKAIEKLQPVLEEYPEHPEVWSLNIEYYYQRYIKMATSLNTLAQLFQDIEMKDEDGNDLNVSISVEGGTGFAEFMEQCVKHTRVIEHAELSSVYIRVFLVDTDPDTTIAPEAIEYFNQAEEAFANRNFEEAIRYYGQALELEPNYYKAALYLGDAHWADGRPEMAIEYFSNAAQTHPHLLEPKKYLVDAYMDSGLWDKAYESCVDAITTYPDVSMLIRMHTICRRLDKRFTSYWMPRHFDLNHPGFEQADIAEEPWNHYRKAKEEIMVYCNEDGLITEPNDLTEQKYMEVYCWEYMLEKSDAPELDFAREMQAKGYLDCYVLVSLYNYVIFEQFQHFSNADEGRIKEYFDLFLCTDR